MRRIGRARAGAATDAGAPGFTLVELLVVFVIIGLMGSITWVSWKALLPNQKLNTAVRDLSEVLFGTRAEAIARNREFRIYYWLDDERYAVRTPYAQGGGIAYDGDDRLGEDDGHVWVDEVDLKQAGLSIESVTIDDETYTDGVVFVRFDPLGASSYHTIVLYQELFDRAFTVEVLPLTGEIRFHDGLFEREPPEERDFE